MGRGGGGNAGGPWKTRDSAEQPLFGTPQLRVTSPYAPSPKRPPASSPSSERESRSASHIASSPALLGLFCGQRCAAQNHRNHGNHTSTAKTASPKAWWLFFSGFVFGPVQCACAFGPEGFCLDG